MSSKDSQYLQIEELEELLDEQGDELYTYLSILSRDKETARDLVQTVFLKFIKKVKEGAILRETARGYLKRMARNEFYQFLRGNRRTVPLPEYELPADDRAREIASNSEEVRIVFLEALDSPEMPPDIAEVLRRRMLLREDFNTICEGTGKSRATIQRMVKKGIQVLVQKFKAAGISIEDLEA